MRKRRPVHRTKSSRTDDKHYLGDELVPMHGECKRHVLRHDQSTLEHKYHPTDKAGVAEVKLEGNGMESLNRGVGKSGLRGQRSNHHVIIT